MQQQVLAALYEIDPARAVKLIEEVTDCLKGVHDQILQQGHAIA